MEKSEHTVQRETRLLTNMTGGLLLRNNSGVWIDKRGIPVRYGLGNDSAKLNKKFKSSDLIGITPLTVRPQDVGRVFGIFTAIEAKPSDWRYSGSDREEAQLFFIDIIKNRGGIAAFASDPGQYLGAIEEFKNGH